MRPGLPAVALLNPLTCTSYRMTKTSTAVPLKEAWESGARLWSVTNRTHYANDLGVSASLAAVTDNVNQAKGDRDPARLAPTPRRREAHRRHPMGPGEVPLAAEHQLGGVEIGQC